MKQFLVEAEKKNRAFLDGAQPVTFLIGDREVTASPPSDGAMMMVMVRMGSDSMVQQAAGITTFMEHVFDKPTVRWLTSRLEDDDDPFGPDLLSEMIGWLLDQWANPPVVDEEPESSPSTRQDGSSSSPGASGRKSKVKRV